MRTTNSGIFSYRSIFSLYFDQPLLLDSLKEVDKMKYQEFQIYFHIRAQYSIGASKQKTENLAHIHVHIGKQ